MEIDSRKLTPNDYFSYRIENEWTDLFWIYHDDTYTVDNQFMNFFNFIAQMCYFKDNLNKDAKDFNSHDFSLLEEVFSKEEHVRFLFNALDWFYKLSFEDKVVSKEKINAFFSSFLGKGQINLFENEDKGVNLFEKCISEGERFDNRNKVMLYCVIHYALKYELSEVPNNGLKYYTRIIRNLLQATRQLNEVAYNTNVRINDFGNYWKIFEQLAQKDAYEFLTNLDVEKAPWAKDDLKQEKIKAEIFIFGGEETKKALFELEEFPALNGLIHQFKPLENKDKLATYSKIAPEIWSDELCTSLVIRSMIACGFDGLYIKPCALGDMYFYGGKKPQANYNKWTTILTKDDNDTSCVILSLLDKYLEQGHLFPSLLPDQKLHNIIKKFIESATVRDWRYYFLKYPAMSDDTWGYGEHCYYAWTNSQYECERLTSVSSNPLLGRHINVFNISVCKELDNNNTGYCSVAWERYGNPSILWIKNGMRLSCQEEGWKIIIDKESRYVLSNEIKKEFTIVDDFILKETNEKDRVEIAVDFIKRVVKGVN
jgi:hypothetical protein